MKLRMFTSEGIEEFRQFIQKRKEDLTVPKPDLNRPPYVEEFTPTVYVDEHRKFSSRLEMAQYLDSIFEKNLDPQVGAENRDVILQKHVNMWSWLTYLWFDQVCPEKPGEEARYIFQPGSRHFYRHLIAYSYFPYRTLKKLGIPNYAKLFLSTPPYRYGDAAEQILGRSYGILYHRTAIEVMFKIFWDEKLNRLKKEASKKTGVGTLRHLCLVLGSLWFNYRIWKMNTEDLIRLLLPVFRKTAKG